MHASFETQRKESEKEIKRLEAELSLQHFRFSKVFETTEKTIAELYKRLLAVLDAAEDLTTALYDLPKEKKEEKLQIIAKAFNEFYDYFRPHKIYLSKSTAKRLSDFLQDITVLVGTEKQLDFLRKFNNDNAMIVLKRMEENRTKIQNDIPELLHRLEDDFRNTLGFPIEDEKAK